MSVRILAIIGLMVVSLVMAMFFSSCQTQADKPLSEKKKAKILAPMADSDFEPIDPEIWPGEKTREGEPLLPLPPDDLGDTETSDLSKEVRGIYLLLPQGGSVIKEFYRRT